MHDVKKVRLAELTEKEKRFNQEKIDKFNELYETCFTFKEKKVYTRSVLEEHLNRLNEINPENTTMWNYRRTLLMNLWGQAKADAAKQKALDEAEKAKKLTDAQQAVEDAVAAASAEDQEAACEKPDPIEVFKAQVGKDIKAELELNTTIVKKDPKCYAAFVHRQWIFSQIQPVAKRVQILEMEKEQCEKLLKIDERNFHAWGYRRWVTTQLRELSPDANSPHAFYSDEKEMKFSGTKIGNNMSNYSAWHNRALIFRRELAKLKEAAVGEEEKASVRTKLVTGLEEEMTLLVGAFYCDSKDQSAWIYAQWVMETLAEADSAAHQAKAQELLENVQELIEAEEEDLKENGGVAAAAAEVTPGFQGQVLSLKWPLWFSIILHRQLGTPDNGAASEDDIQKLIARLCEVDPPRAVCFRATLGKKKP